jgi:hypothetical protein
MPRVPAVDELNESERRARLVEALTEGFLRYLQSDQYAADRQQRQNNQDSDPHCLDLPLNPVLSVNTRKIGELRPE